MNKILLFIGILVGAIYYHQQTKAVYMPVGAMNGLTLVSSQNLDTTTDPCLNRPYCVVIYLAPWCPHCRNAVKYVNDLRSFWASTERPGLKVVVGADKKENLESMAQTIGGNVYLDLEGKFKDLMKVDFYPTWYVISKEGMILKRKKAAIGWVNDEVNQHR